MRKFIYLLFIVMVANVWAGVAGEIAVSPYVDLDVMGSMISRTDTAAINAVCREISTLEANARDHATEVKYLHAAIDSFNVDAIASLLMNKIGIYDPEQDSITPLEYMCNDQFAERIMRVKPNYHDGVVLNFYVIGTVSLITGAQEVTPQLLVKLQEGVDKLPDDIYNY